MPSRRVSSRSSGMARHIRSRPPVAQVQNPELTRTSTLRMSRGGGMRDSAANFAVDKMGATLNNIAMRLPLLFCLGITAATPFVMVKAQDAVQSLSLYAVHIYRPPKPAWTGYGVYLGNGYVITAAHVAGLSLWTAVQVEFAGKNLPAKVIKRGQFHNVDLTVLSVDDQQLPVSLDRKSV